MDSADWNFWIDRGGTFTDIIGHSPDGRLYATKKLSESANSAIEGVKELLCAHGAKASALASLRMGTTIGTNALLEHTGARAVFVCTKGFADALRIGYQNRPDIFALEIKLPQMIYESVVEFDERLDASGAVLEAPNLENLRASLKLERERGIKSCAIALMHAYKFPQHELLAKEIARELGFEQISVSHECAALMKYISRSDTTLVDAYLTPLLNMYTKELESRLADFSEESQQKVSLHYMQSNGGLVESSLFKGKDSILSGPAGGMVGAIKAAKNCGFDRIITFDMGGTSTDVAYYAGEIEHIYDAELAGMRIRAPMMDIHTVAAGGGSVLSFDGTRFRVGPESAGAIPGPLSYGRNGPLALTDANLLLGRIQPAYFPNCFGPAQNESLNLALVQKAFAELSVRINSAAQTSHTAEDVAFGFIKIAVSKMANAIKHVSVQRGHDIRNCILVCFGGAGGQHACLIADELGVERVLVHPLAGVLSAFGIGLAEVRIVREIDFNQLLNSIDLSDLLQRLKEVKQNLSELLSSRGVATESQQSRVVALLKRLGSDFTLSVPFNENFAELEAEFSRRHLARYGFDDSNRMLVLSSLSVQLEGEQIDSSKLSYVGESLNDLDTNASLNSGASVDPRASVDPCASVEPCVYADPCASVDPRASVDPCASAAPRASAEPCVSADPCASVAPCASVEANPSLSTGADLPSVDLYLSGESTQKGTWCKTALLQRNQITDTAIKGPILIVEANTTTVVENGWSVRKLDDGSLLLEKAEKGLSNEPEEELKVDPITLELFNNLFSFVAEQMGLTLQNTSQSVNIKERLDFSCAIFDAQGNLVANAPHIPVHLGSMGESVKSLIQAKGESLRPGDAYAINDPYNGGTHLPDLTVVSPAFDESGHRLQFFVASRGHHADIGGISPGSMPSESRSIEEEGILFQHMLVMRDSQILEEQIKGHLSAGPYPARNIAQNLADLKAQVAANVRGIKQLNELVLRWGEKVVLAYMQFVQDNAEESVRRAISKLSSGDFVCTMDDGSVISVKVEIDQANRKAKIDFAGTSKQTQTNFNAPLAVCKAAVLYVFRTLVDDDIPLNAGCFRPLELIVPENSLLNPSFPAPVVAGNVETSQVIVDVLYGALGVMAASQGTMNNLSFGNSKYQYYETICGGTGAGASFAGAGPVHSNMTNSRLTDPEVLETEFPVVLKSFSILKGSGGSGRFKGGDGAERRMLFRERMKVSILSNRRLHAPYGLAGAKDALPGENIVLRKDGAVQALSFRESIELEDGDLLVIKTPGGGGFGAP